MKNTTHKPKHIFEAEKALVKVGLAGQDWIAAKYLLPENKPDLIIIYQGNYWFTVCYKNKNGVLKWMEFEDKPAFDTKELAIKFANACGSKYKIQE